MRRADAPARNAPCAAPVCRRSDLSRVHTASKQPFGESGNGPFPVVDERRLAGQSRARQRHIRCPCSASPKWFTRARSWHFTIPSFTPQGELQAFELEHVERVVQAPTMAEVSKDDPEAAGLDPCGWQGWSTMSTRCTGPASRPATWSRM
jgi:hypothetical protein